MKGYMQLLLEAVTTSMVDLFLWWLLYLVMEKSVKTDKKKVKNYSDDPPPGDLWENLWWNFWKNLRKSIWRNPRRNSWIDIWWCGIPGETPGWAPEKSHEEFLEALSNKSLVDYLKEFVVKVLDEFLGKFLETSLVLCKRKGQVMVT